MTAQEAWSQFFELLIIRLTYATKIKVAPKEPCWMVLNEIRQFLLDKASRFSESRHDFNGLSAVYGTTACFPAFKDHVALLKTHITLLREATYECQRQALQHQLLQDQEYLKYAPYLNELADLTSHILFEDYFLQGKTPLSTLSLKNVDPLTEALLQSPYD